MGRGGPEGILSSDTWRSCHGYKRYRKLRTSWPGPTDPIAVGGRRPVGGWTITSISIIYSALLHLGVMASRALSSDHSLSL